MTRPRLLDLFCGAGGAAMGYHRAGFDVIGIDNRPQPRYPFEFYQADALGILDGSEWTEWPWSLCHFDAIHASPPCQAYSRTQRIWKNAKGHPDHLPAVRDLLTAAGMPWVIENVPGAPMRADIVLCGTMFGLQSGAYELWRHRLFETSGFYALTPQCQHHAWPVNIGGGQKRQRLRAGTVAGNPGGSSVRDGIDLASLADWKVITGIDWMTSSELCEAIPPAYTEYIGRQLLQHLERAA